MRRPSVHRNYPPARHRFAPVWVVAIGLGVVGWMGSQGTFVRADGPWSRSIRSASPSGLSPSGQSPSGQSASGPSVSAEECLVRFADEIEVPALDAGRVKEILVLRNDIVEAAAQLGRLDDRTLRYRRHAARLRLNSAKALALDDVEVRYAEVALAEATVELDANRSIQADAGGAIPESRMRQLRLAVQRAELEVAQAKKRKQRAELEAQLREADLGLIEDQLARLRVTAPIGGIVLEVMRSSGEWVEKGETLVKLGQIDRLHVHALVRSEQLSPRSCRDLAVTINWRDHDGQQYSLDGRVLSVDPQTLPGGRFRIHAEIKNRQVDKTKGPSWLLVPGTKVDMQIHRSGEPSNQRHVQKAAHRIGGARL